MGDLLLVYNYPLSEIKVENEEKVLAESLDTQPFNENSINVIPVIEEDIVVDKKIVEKGRVIIQKTIHNDEISVEVPVSTEHVNVERVPVNEIIDTHPSTRYEGDTMIIPVVKEVMVKKLFLLEEIRITRHQEITTHKQTVTLKKEEVTITRKDN